MAQRRVGSGRGCGLALEWVVWAGVGQGGIACCEWGSVQIVGCVGLGCVCGEVPRVWLM